MIVVAGTSTTEKGAGMTTARKTRKSPSLRTLMAWEEEGGCEATDGCWVEPDGTCEHGAESWLLVMGMI